MNEKVSNLKVKEEIRNVDTVKSNVFKVVANDENIIIDFGQTVDKENVNVIASVAIDPKSLLPIIERLILTGVSYQKKHNIDLGINLEESKGEAE